MSVPQLVKQIHQLTYKEMLEVAESVSLRIMTHEMARRPGEPVEGPAYQAVADALLGITANTDLNEQEDKILRQIFSRKRAITVERDGRCWRVDIASVQGAGAVGDSLRTALMHSLDQIITLQALKT